MKLQNDDAVSSAKQPRYRMSFRALAVALLASLFTADVAALRLSTARQTTALQLQADFLTCKRLAARIEQLRKRTQIAGSREMELTELSRRFEQAANATNIPAESIVRISPEEARRLSTASAGGESMYLEKPVIIQLSGVGLAKLVRFLYVMSTDSSSMNVKSLRLTAPRHEEAIEKWAAEVSFSYLIYSPPQKSPQAVGVGK